MNSPAPACAVLSSAYCPPVEYFMAAAATGKILIETHESYIKQTYRNRCNIVSSLGVQPLTVPVEKPAGSNAMKDMRISEHGNWRHLHLNAIDSAYGNSPFHEYYRDDFLPFYENRYENLVEYNTLLLEKVCELMDIPFNIEFSSSFIDPRLCSDFDDYRPFMTSKKADFDMPELIVPKTYYQVFSGRHGFLGNMSCIDLLFNMGPESCLVV